MTMRKILAISPTEAGETSKIDWPKCLFGYHLGSMLHLYRSGDFMPGKGSVLGIHKIAPGNSFSLSRCVWEITEECAAKAYKGVFLDDDTVSPPLFRSLVGALTPVLEQKGLVLYLPEKWEGFSPTAHIVLSTAISGGSLQLRLEEAVEKYGAHRIALDMEPVRHRFTLPAPDGQGQLLSKEELQKLLSSGVQTFYSRDLCENYFTYQSGGQTQFVLFDTAGTLGKKLSLAQGMGIGEAFFLYSECREFLTSL